MTRECQIDRLVFLRDWLRTNGHTVTPVDMEQVDPGALLAKERERVRVLDFYQARQRREMEREFIPR